MYYAYLCNLISQIIECIDSVLSNFLQDYMCVRYMYSIIRDIMPHVTNYKIVYTESRHTHDQLLWHMWYAVTSVHMVNVK